MTIDYHNLSYGDIAEILLYLRFLLLFQSMESGFNHGPWISGFAVSFRGISLFYLETRSLTDETAGRKIINIQTDNAVIEQTLQTLQKIQPRIS